MLALLLAAAACLLVLTFLKLNRGQEVERLLYEHKFLPRALGRYVGVGPLNETNT